MDRLSQLEELNNNFIEQVKKLTKKTDIHIEKTEFTCDTTTFFLYNTDLGKSTYIINNDRINEKGE